MAKSSTASAATPSDWATDGWVAFVVAVLLGLHALLGWDAARRLTVTHDEYWHLPVGVLNVRTGRFEFDPLNPSLTRLWAAAPAVAMGAKPGAGDLRQEIEAYGDTFVDANGPRYVALLTAGRGANLIWSIFGGAILAVWTRQLYGRLAAMTAALLWACCPTILGHAALVTPDVGLTTWFLAALYAQWRFAHTTSWPWALMWGAAVGLALSTKFTAILLVPLAPVLWLIVRFRASPPDMSLRDLAAKWGTAALLALLVLNSLHLFQGTFSAIRGYDFLSNPLKKLNTAPAIVRAIPVPLPKPWLVGLDRQRFIMEHRHPAYLDGRWTEEGFRDYYLRALAYKLPHALQLLIALGVWAFFRPTNQPRPWRLWLFLGIPAACLLAISSFSGMQLGIRYVLLIFPALFLAAVHAVASADWTCARWRSIATWIALAASPLALRHHPQHLAYFNELAGGPIGGRAHLLDSNLDWGQDLRELRTYVDRHPMPGLRLAYFGTLPPDKAGLGGLRPPPAGAPQPGWHAVSVNFVKGRPHFLRLGERNRYRKQATFGELSYFNDLTPVAHVGSSIDIYHVTQADVARWYSRHARF